MRRIWRITLVVTLVMTGILADSAAADGPKGNWDDPIYKPNAEEYDPGGGSSSSMSTSGQAPEFYFCQYESRPPHDSTHEPGVVNAESLTTCTAAVFVTVKIVLYKEFAWLWWTRLTETPVVSYYGSINTFVNYPCQGNLNYRTVSQHSDTGAWTNSGQTGNTQYITCQ